MSVGSSISGEAGRKAKAHTIAVTGRRAGVALMGTSIRRGMWVLWSGLDDGKRVGIVTGMRFDGTVMLDIVDEHGLTKAANIPARYDEIEQAKLSDIPRSRRPERGSKKEAEMLARGYAP